MRGVLFSARPYDVRSFRAVNDARIDPQMDAGVAALGARSVDLATLLAGSDIITLHCPLTPESHHLIDGTAIARMREGVMIVNTSRGALVDVYEEEADLFFEDLSDRVITDDVFSRLLTFPNVLITAHQAFFTTEALARIASTTLDNIAAFGQGVPSGTEVSASEVTAP